MICMRCGTENKIYENGKLVPMSSGPCFMCGFPIEIKDKQVNKNNMHHFFDGILITLEALSDLKKRKKKVDTYEELEFNCRTSLSDEDMLKMHIDFALERGDQKVFLKLSQQLKEVDFKNNERK